ncbi:MAG: OmpP1/FadL family transporter [Myxococcota bacterium]
MSRAGRVALLLGALGMAAPSAHASLFDSYGYGARATAMGGAMTAQSTNYDAVYYNPANLLTRKAAHFGFGFNVLAPQLSVDRLSGEGPFEPKLPEPNVGFQLGAATALGGVFAERIAFGVTLFHPLLRLTRIESIDPIQPTFYRYDSLPDKLILAFALAGEPLPWLRLGVGLQVLAGLGGGITTSVSLVEGVFSQEAIDIDVDANAGVTAGIAVGPLWGLRLGITWRSRLELSYDVPIEVLLEEIGVLDVHIKGVSLFTPDQLAIGLSWESAPPDMPGVTVEAGITWEHWSMAPSHLAAFDLTLDDSVIGADPEQADHEPEDLISVHADAIPLGAIDTVTARLGAEWRPVPCWAVRGGYVYRPTPLPNPVYQTNTMDASAHVLSLGGGFIFQGAEPSARSPLQIDVGVQLTVLTPRTVVKAPEAALNGSYRFSGVVWNATLDVRHDF